ncbi:MAG: LON peptidase substrate-binding domain-containing protein [Planctomycetes bacterium]|nr:LON peptidase substrate-binding domain-containing protein [Planctomycetota bacterium]
MTEAQVSLKNFRGTARLFPLPNLVLFPSVIQPLHIFEPRYRQMMADALDDDRLLALVLLRPGWEEDYHLRPPVHAVACLGAIANEECLADGRYNLLLHGLQRVRIVEELPAEKLYRCARVELLEDAASAAGLECALREELALRMPAWFAGHGAAQQQAEQLLEASLPLSALCDIFSFALPLPTKAKQGLLEELDVTRRARRLLTYLKEHKPPPAPQSAERRFPPEFSPN